MSCPRCGSFAPARAGRCPVCGRESPAGAVGAGVLTPPLPSPDAKVTHLGQASPSFADAESETVLRAPDETVLATPPPGTMAGGGRTPQPGGGPLVVGQNFGSRYHIIRLLGSGGMGSVYQAWDQELEVAVAVKVIRPDSTNDPMMAAELERRFKRELLLARQVTDRHVVRIHDIGEIDGIKYITMPYIQGADLATILNREGRLAVPRALSIARQVAAGLAAAHEAGVVHRDLKPANIMVDESDYAVIMDFGIARSTSGATAFAMTVGPQVIGTVEYMAPEQATAESVDQRADLYAFGLILRDMLVGNRHAAATSAVTELMARIQHPPPGIRTIDPALPESLEQLVNRCLEPNLTARYQSAVELLRDIDRVAEGHALGVGSPRSSRRSLMSRGRGIALLAAAGLAIVLGGAGDG